MVAVADTALDLLVLELVLHRDGRGVGLLGLGVLAPVGAGPEDDVLADAGRVGRRTRRVLGRGAELGPRLAVGDARVDDLLVGDEADAAGRLDLLPVLVVAVLDHRCAAVLVGDLLGRGQLLDGLVQVLVVGPVVPGRGENDS
jgi:hypothetical protein